MILGVHALIWFAFSLIDGFVQAYYFDLFPSQKNHRNLHPFFNAQRGFIWAVMVYSEYLSYGFWVSAWYGLALGITFSFFHNGAYGFTRNKLNPLIYLKGWWANKEFDPAKDKKKALMEFNAIERTVMAVAGVIGIAIIILKVQYNLF